MRIRDKEISILFIIGFTFLFILVCTGYVTVSNWLWQYKKQTVSYEYTKNLYIHSKNSYNAALETSYHLYHLRQIHHPHLRSQIYSYQKLLSYASFQTALLH